MEQAKKSPDVSASNETDSASVNKSKPVFFWFVAHGALLKGPYSTGELQKLIASKEISERFFAWRDGFKEWRPLYGIEEFINENQGEDESYPSVPVPGAASQSQSSERHVPNNVPIYKVRFNRSRWSDLKKTEVVFLFLGSLIFTMAILSMAFKVFENEWNKVWGRRASGILYSVGRVPEALPLYLVAPLQSAPGLKHQDSHFVAVDVESNMNHLDTLDFAGFKIQSELPKSSFESLAWDASHTYSRRMRVQGYMDLKNPAMIHVENPGSAYEPVQSGRLSDRFVRP